MIKIGKSEDLIHPHNQAESLTKKDEERSIFTYQGSKDAVTGVKDCGGGCGEVGVLGRRNVRLIITHRHGDK